MAKRSTFVGLDVHEESIAVALAEGGRFGEVRTYVTVGGDLDALDEVRRTLVRPARTLRFVYEAGSCGFTIFRHLTAQGEDCAVVSPSMIPKTAGRPREDRSPRRGARRPDPATRRLGRPPRRNRPRVGPHQTSEQMGLRRRARCCYAGSRVRLCTRQQPPISGREQAHQLSGHCHVPRHQRLRLHRYGRRHRGCNAGPCGRTCLRRCSRQLDPRSDIPVEVILASRTGRYLQGRKTPRADLPPRAEIDFDAGYRGPRSRATICSRSRA